jgi:hypothetical protein
MLYCFCFSFPLPLKGFVLLTYNKSFLLIHRSGHSKMLDMKTGAHALHLPKEYIWSHPGLKSETSWFNYSARYQAKKRRRTEEVSISSLTDEKYSIGKVRLVTPMTCDGHGMFNNRQDSIIDPVWTLKKECWRKRKFRRLTNMHKEPWSKGSCS